MPEVGKIYETGLLFYRRDNTAYPLNADSFQHYKVDSEKRRNIVLKNDFAKVKEFCIYIHVPFEMDGDKCDDYVSLLLEEMDLYGFLAKDRSVIGFDIGGNPLSLSAENLRGIVEKAHSLFRIEANIIQRIEIPVDLAAKSFDELKTVSTLGFQQVSLVESKMCGRSDWKIYEKAVRNLRKAGFEKINLGITYGYLNLNDKDLENIAMHAVSLKVDQITLFRNAFGVLEPESNGVSLYKVIRQYRFIYGVLTSNGYFSNNGRNTFCRDEKDLGTSDYMFHRFIEGVPYIGMGLGAHSCGTSFLACNEEVAGKDVFEAYRQKISQGEFPVQAFYALPQEECIARTLVGSLWFGFIDLECFRKRFGGELKDVYPEAVDYVIRGKLMTEENGKLFLTARGADYISGVIPLFYSKSSQEELIKLYENKKVPESEGEEIFLKKYDIKKYDRPSVATDVVGMTIRTVDAGNYRSPTKEFLSVLLIRRGEHPYIGKWALPGGFLRYDEPVEHCAQRELFEETGLNTDALYPIGCFSLPGRDPRGWIISNAFLSIVNKEDCTLMSGDDAMDAQWFDLSFIEENGILNLIFTHDNIQLKAVLKVHQNAFGLYSFEILSSDLAFDHAKIIATALKQVQTPHGLRKIAFAFLPAEFTIADLQNVCELLTGEKILPANFRRKMLPYLKATDHTTEGDGHRPALLYSQNTNMEE